FPPIINSLITRSPHENIGAKAALHNLRIGRKAFTARLCGRLCDVGAEATQGPARMPSRAGRGVTRSSIGLIKYTIRPDARELNQPDKSRRKNVRACQSGRLVHAAGRSALREPVPTILVRAGRTLRPDFGQHRSTSA